MVEVLHSGCITDGLAQLVGAVRTQLGEVELGLYDKLTDADVLAELREVETTLRSAAALQVALTAQLEQRAIPARLTLGSTAGLLQTVLRLSPREAADRVAMALACGPRVAVTGQQLPPVRPSLSAALATGSVSQEHCRVILKALRRLPATVSVTAVEQAERDLVEAAATFAPREVGRVGEQIRAWLDPDGAAPNDREHQRLRSFYLCPEDDGSYTARGRLTPSCGAKLMALLTAHSAPRPATSPETAAETTTSREAATVSSAETTASRATETVLSAEIATSRAAQVSTAETTASREAETATAGPANSAIGTAWDVGVMGETDAGDLLPDQRTHAQRLHDALEHLADLALSERETAPTGAPTEIVITMTAEQFLDRTGFAQTSFGQLLDVDTALSLGDEAGVTLLGRSPHGGVLCHGRTKRVATRVQTRALIARDRGCSFPSCDKPPEHCQRHHVIAWADGGRTDLDNLTLLCNRHHREFQRAGWTCHIRDGVPWWTPPSWTDPHRIPRRNPRIRPQLTAERE